MREQRKILQLNKNRGQSVVEYCVLFVAIVTVMIIAINGPIRTSLNGTFDGLITAISDSVDDLIP